MLLQVQCLNWRELKVLFTWNLQEALPHGKHAAGTPSKNLVPLTPLGPSVVRIAGMPSLCTEAVCQKSVPEMREIFSGVVSLLSTSSTSKSFADFELPFRICFSGSEAAGMVETW